MAEHAVVIAGAGPTGLMLAGELALAKVDVAIVERRATQELEGLRASGLHSRTIELLDQRGIAERFVSQGQKHPIVLFHGRLDISDFPTRHNYILALRQNVIERLLAGWIGELSVPIYRSREVTGFAQDADGVDVKLNGGDSLRARYLVGCDGGRSVIRKTAGIEFPGSEPTTAWLIAEVEWSDEPRWGFHTDAAGTHAIGKLEGQRAGIVLAGQPLTEAEPTLHDVRNALVAAYGTDFGVRNPTWISRFTDMTRQAASYRDRRVLLAGDAAHVHPPMGGQGLNIGVQDAVNLGWKLAQVIKRESPDALLDTYHAERHPVGARVLRSTMALSALRRSDDHSKALGDYVSEFLAMDEPRKRIVAETSGLGIHYDLGKGHPLLGRRMPDLDLTTSTGPRRVFALLHDARPLLLNFGAAGAFDTAASDDRLRVVDAQYDGAWNLPELGAVAAPAAALVRPDGYVAWAGDGTSAGLAEALQCWFGLELRSP